MKLDHHSLGRYAAALQCVAEDFRIEAAHSAARPRELRRFAKLLDHMAASLIVRRPPEPALVRSDRLELAPPALARRPAPRRKAAPW
jgi:hypothetical protein